MSYIKITVTNPDGQTVCPILVERPAFDEYLDNPRRMTAKIDKNSGLNSQGTVRVDRKGKIILLGHIKRFDQSKKEYDVLTLDSAEAILDDRIGQFYRYPASTTLNSMLASDMGGSVVGLLAMANGLIPRGSFTLHSGAIYKWAGMGTASRLGTLTQLYQNATLLTKVSAIPVAAASWYQSATDLYVWCSDSRDPKYHLIIAPNFKDTLVRLGTISTGTTAFAVCYEVGPNKIFPPIKALILAGGLEYTIRYEKDGYAYLDGSVTVGKGSASEPVATYIETKNAEITIDQMDGFGKLQALLGQGAGAGITQQCAAAFDTTTLGVWREGIYQAGGLFGTMLSSATTKVFADCQDPTIYNVRAIDQDWSQAVGNYVAIIRNDYQPVYKRIKHISQKPGGDMLLEVGQRLRTLQELLKAGEEVQNILSSFYGSHTQNGFSWSLAQQNIDSYTPISIDFDLNSSEENGEIDVNFPYQVTLSLKIGWYTSSVKNATVSGPAHSSVGSHAGYGGKETSSKPMTAHSVNSFTDDYTSNTEIVPSALHSHTGRTGTAADNSYDSALVYVSIAYEDDGEYVYWVGIDEYEFVTFSEYDHDHVTGGSGVSGQTTVADDQHRHGIPAHVTQAAADQSHVGGADTAKDRAGSSTHADQTLTDDNTKLEKLLEEVGVWHSVHYLTLSVKLNGSHVPGSPFSGSGGTGLYVGDSLDAIDLTDLATVGTKNTLTLEVTEFGGAGPVRCSISGQVAVNAVISAF